MNFVRKVKARAKKVLQGHSVKSQYEMLLKHSEKALATIVSGNGLKWVVLFANGQAAFWKKVVDGCRRIGDLDNAEGYEERVFLLKKIAVEAELGEVSVASVKELEEYIGILKQELKLLEDGA